MIDDEPQENKYPIFPEGKTMLRPPRHRDFPTMTGLIVGLTALGALTGQRLQHKLAEELRRDASAPTVSAPPEKSRDGLNLWPLLAGGIAGATTAAGINIGSNAIARRRRKSLEELLRSEHGEPEIGPSFGLS